MTLITLKKILLFILFISFGITVLYSSGVVYVDDDYTPATEGWNYDHFSYLQDAINAVEDSGIVYVMNGTYYNNYTINKPLSLIGESTENTIIDGNESGENLITIISTTNVTITNLTIHNGFRPLDESLYFGVFSTDSSNIFIHNLVIYNVHIAIASLGDISNFTATNNTISDAFVGAGVLFTPGALVAENYIHNSFVALAIYNCVGSDIIFENNTLKDNNIGVQITASNYTIVRNNIVDNSSDAALYFVTEDADDSYYNLIYNNKFTNSTNFQLMDWLGTNYFNTTKTLGNNIIDGPYIGGNYYDDYLGLDIDNDGIGDTLIPYNSKNNITNGGDYLPLVYVLPYVEIISPEHKTYNKKNILINITHSSNANVWYNWNGVNVTYTIPTIVEFNQGVNVLHVWAKNAVNDVNYTNVTFTVIIPSSSSSREEPSFEYEFDCETGILDVESDIGIEIRLMSLVDYSTYKNTTNNNGIVSFTLARDGKYRIYTDSTSDYYSTTREVDFEFCKEEKINETEIIIPDVNETNGTESNETEVIIPEVNITEIENLIELVESELENAIGENKEVSEAQQKLSEAKIAFNNGNYALAEQLLNEALTLILNAEAQQPVIDDESLEGNVTESDEDEEEIVKGFDWLPYIAGIIVLLILIWFGYKYIKK